MNEYLVCYKIRGQNELYNLYIKSRPLKGKGLISFIKRKLAHQLVEDYIADDVNPNYIIIVNIINVT